MTDNRKPWGDVDERLVEEWLEVRPRLQRELSDFALACQDFLNAYEHRIKYDLDHNYFIGATTEEIEEAERKEYRQWRRMSGKQLDLATRLAKIREERRNSE